MLAFVCLSLQIQFRFQSGERKKTVSVDGTMFEKSGVMCGGLADIQKKAKRWDTKQIDGLKKKRDEYMAEVKELAMERRKESTMPGKRLELKEVLFIYLSQASAQCIPS